MRKMTKNGEKRKYEQGFGELGGGRKAMSRKKGGPSGSKKRKTKSGPAQNTKWAVHVGKGM